MHFHTPLQVLWPLSCYILKRKRPRPRVVSTHFHHMGNLTQEKGRAIIRGNLKSLPTMLNNLLLIRTLKIDSKSNHSRNSSQVNYNSCSMILPANLWKSKFKALTITYMPPRRRNNRLWWTRPAKLLFREPSLKAI